MRTFRFFTILFFFAVSQVAIAASDYSFGLTGSTTFSTLSLPYSGSWITEVTSTAGSFAHKYNFTTPATSFGGVGGSAINYSYSIFSTIVSSNITNFALSLYDGTTNGLLSGPGTAFSFSNVPSGPYYILATGMSTGTVNGSYAVSMNVSPIPEPEQWAMMLVGLTLVGLQTLRAKKAALPLNVAAA